jgi:hypothetical protein
VPIIAAYRQESPGLAWAEAVIAAPDRPIFEADGTKLSVERLLARDWQDIVCIA